MRINRIKLNNFSLIKAAMNKNEIDIDLSKSKNKIILLQGDNGSGKTSLLSNFHPFPHIGTLDLRNSNDLIVDEKDGYKYIEIQNGNDIYEILHKYVYQKDKWKVSSSIKLNGKELNPSGSVTSFYDIIKDLFGIDYSFLKLIRLGSNVSNLIKLKSSERKEFVALLVSEISIFSKLYKNVNEQSKKLKMELKILSDNLSKLNITDVDEYDQGSKLIDKKLQELILQREEQSHEIGKLTGKIDMIANNNNFDKFDEISDKIKSCYKEIEALNIPVEFKDCELDILKDILDVSMTDQKNFELDYEKKSYISNEMKKDISVLNEKLIDIKEKINLLNNIPEINLINEKLDEVKRKIKLKEKESYNLYMVSIDDINEDNEKLSILDELISSIFEIDDNGYKLFSDLYTDNLNDLSAVRIELNKRLIDIESKKSNNELKQKKLEPPNECSLYKSCQYYKMYNKGKSLSLKEYEENKEIIQFAFTICDIVHQIDKIVDERSKHKCLPFVITKNDIHYLILNKHKLSSGFKLSENERNQNVLYDLYENEKYRKLIAQYEELEAQKKMYTNNNRIGVEMLLKECDETFELYDKKKVEFNRYYNDYIINQLKDMVNSNKSRIDTLKDVIDKITKRDEIEKEILNLNHELNKVIQDRKEYESYESDMNKHKQSILILNEEICNLNKNLLDRKVNLESYNRIIDNKKDIKKKFEDVEEIKESLSPTKGMPLLFMKLYFKGIQIVANNIISEVYGDKIELCDFIIDDKEFTIPYIVNGIKIKDISSASQGESSVINLALSLAIMENFISSYNILLLDEIDGVLSPKNKKQFFAILDHQINKINAEQVFVISHNNLYETYPCDIILTSKGQNIPDNVNVIYKV